jgi:YVTN family beta-propeller protein
MSFWDARRSVGWALVLGGALGAVFLVSTPKVPENVAYVSDEKGGITVIDLKTLEVRKEIGLKGAGPRGIGLTPDGRYLVTANKETADAWVIDTGSFRTVRRIHIGSNPEFLKLHPSGQWLFTSHEPGSAGGPPKKETEEKETEEKEISASPSEIVALNVQDWSVARAFPAGTETEGIEFSRDGKFLIVANEAENTIGVYEIETGKLVRKTDVTPYGLRPRGVKVSRNGNAYAVTLEASNKLLLLGRNFDVTRSVATRAGPYGVAFDREGRRLLVAAAKAQVLQVFDADSLQLLAEVPVGQRCWHFTFTPDDSEILVACGRSNDVHIIDAKSYQPIRTLQGLQMPWGIVTYPRAYGSLDLP